jgi:hypothetical protein
VDYLGWLRARSIWVAAVISGGLGLTFLISNVLTQQQQADLRELEKEFPNVKPEDLAELLAIGFTADEIRALLKSGYSPARIKILINAGFSTNEIVQLQKFGFNPVLLVAKVKLAEAGDGITLTQLHQIITEILKDFNYQSSDPQVAARYHYQAQVARDLLESIIAYEEVHGATALDIVTFKAIVEVTLQDSGKTGQILEFLRLDTARKPLLLLAPNYTPAAAKELERQAMNPANNPYGIPVKVFYGSGAEQQLIQYLRQLGEPLTDVSTPVAV